MFEEKMELEKKAPISLEGWVTLLSGEINRERTEFYMFSGIIVSVIMVVLALLVSIKLGGHSIETMVIMTVIFLLGLFAFKTFSDHQLFFQKKLKPLEEIRDEILSGTLKDHEQIHTRYICARGKK